MATNIDIEVQIMQDNLCDLRKIAGWTAETLAGKLGTTKQTISNIENQKVRMSRIQYIAIRAVFECELVLSRDNTPLRKMMNILFGNVQIYLTKRDEIRNAMVAIASIANAGISGLQLYSSVVALLAPLGHMLSASNYCGSSEPSLMWLIESLDESTRLESKEIDTTEEKINEESQY